MIPISAITPRAMTGFPVDAVNRIKRTVGRSQPKVATDDTAPAKPSPSATFTAEGDEEGRRASAYLGAESSILPFAARPPLGGRSALSIRFGQAKIAPKATAGGTEDGVGTSSKPSPQSTVEAAAPVELDDEAAPAQRSANPIVADLKRNEESWTRNVLGPIDGSRFSVDRHAERAPVLGQGLPGLFQDAFVPSSPRFVSRASDDARRMAAARGTQSAFAL